jgi:hypothetical protein
MLEIRSISQYENNRLWREKGQPGRIKYMMLTILLFGSMGAITWAIRGTSGWGGVDGTVVAGMMWALLWYYVCSKIGIDARNIVFWLGFGIALGGELGYGQYTGWILGKFYVGDKIIPIAPWIGYIWFMICGIGWAAPGGIILGWALGKRMSTTQWIVRSVFIIILLVFLFAWPFMEWMAAQMTDFWPGLLFPNAELGIYSGELGHQLQRTIYTNTQNFAVLLWWIAALVTAFLQKDKTTLFVGLLLGIGFGIGFMQSGAWCLGYQYANGYIDWWKIWELNAGFNLGILYAIAMFWAIRQLDKNKTETGNGLKMKSRDTESSHTAERYKTIGLALAGTLMIFFMGFEYFFFSTILLCIFFMSTMLLSLYPWQMNLTSRQIAEKRLDLLLLFCVFILVFLMLHGGSERAGVVLGLYPVEAVNQYAWPMERILLAAPFLLILLGSALYRIWNILFAEYSLGDKPVVLSRLSTGMVDLMTGMGFIGALSIWPAKIGILYALFLMLGLFAFSRINYT